MSVETTRYAIRLDDGRWYHGRDDSGDARWTRVPSWAHTLTDPTELAELLEWLEQSDLEYSILEAK